VEFRILGLLEVRDGERVLPVGGVRRRAVLGILLLEANRTVAVDRLYRRHLATVLARRALEDAIGR
jgi:DNA-binding SARP family transcriptional activator